MGTEFPENPVSGQLRVAEAIQFAAWLNALATRPDLFATFSPVETFPVVRNCGELGGCIGMADGWSPYFSFSSVIFRKTVLSASVSVPSIRLPMILRSQTC